MHTLIRPILLFGMMALALGGLAIATHNGAQGPAYTAAPLLTR